MRPLVRRRKSSRQRFARESLRSVIAEAVEVAAASEREVCGLLVDNGHEIELVRLRNAERRPGGFRFFVRDVREVERAARVLGHAVVGTFHSHPLFLAEPGEGDLRQARNGSLMLIIDCTGRRAMLWRVKGGRARRVPYVAR